MGMKADMQKKKMKQLEDGTGAHWNRECKIMGLEKQRGRGKRNESVFIARERRKEQGSEKKETVKYLFILGTVNKH